MIVERQNGVTNLVSQDKLQTSKHSDQHFKNL